MSFITNKYCLTQWISKLLGSFEIHWGRHYLANFRGSGGHSKDNGLQGKANFYRSRPAAADFPRDVCLTVSRNHAVFLLYPFTCPLLQINTVLLSGFQSPSGALRSTGEGTIWQISADLAGIVKTTVYKAKPIFTGLGHYKLSQSLTLFCKHFVDRINRSPVAYLQNGTAVRSFDFVSVSVQIQKYSDLVLHISMESQKR